MKVLREALDKLEYHFHKGGRLERFYPVYEAADTFLFTPGSRTKSGPHVRDAVDLKRTMTIVVLALLPAIFFGLFNTGYQMLRATSDAGLRPEDAPLLQALWLGLKQFLPIYIVTIAVGGTLEAIFSIVRKHEINEGFLVTSMLFPLTLPPDIPLWQAAIGIAFGVVVGKEIFGGTGMNILNPALTARVFLYFAYPAQISGDLVWVAAARSQWVDGFSGATPLGNMAVVGNQAADFGYTWLQSFLGFIPGSIGETSVPAILLGAGILIFSKIGSWRIMLGCLLGLVWTALVFNALAPSPTHYLAVSPLWHMVVGSFAFGAVFMATDPVSASQTNLGRWIYGFMIGALTALVRVLNPAYPEGVMLAIIFMNIFAPVIDYYVTKANIKRREVRLGVQ